MRVKLEVLWVKSWEEKQMLWKAYVCLRNEESLKKNKTKSFPRDWCLRAALRLNGPFYIFQLGKASTLIPLAPHPPRWRRIKKKEAEKLKTAWERLAPNMLREELDIVSHKNATNTLNGLRVILFGYLHFAIFTATEGGWLSIFRKTWGAQVTKRFPYAPRSYVTTRPRSIGNQSTWRGRSQKRGIDRLLSKKT